MRIFCEGNGSDGGQLDHRGFRFRFLSLSYRAKIQEHCHNAKLASWTKV